MSIRGVNEDEFQVSEATMGWADIKEAYKTSYVLMGEAIAIENKNIGNQTIECLKIAYKDNYGYLPKSLIDDYEFKSLQTFLGKRLEFVVESIDLDSHAFICNRIRALETAKNVFWKRNAKEGNTINAVVRGVNATDVWLLVEGVPVTMNRSEFSYSYVDDLRYYIEIGDELPVKLTKVVLPSETYTKNVGGKSVEEVAEEGYLEVSHKVLEEDPWTTINQYQEKGYYSAVIHKIHMDHGIFFTLPTGIQSRSNFPPNSAGTPFRVGDRINVKIQAIDAKNRRIKAIIINPRAGRGMGMKQDNRVQGIRR